MNRPQKSSPATFSICSSGWLFSLNLVHILPVLIFNHVCKTTYNHHEQHPWNWSPVPSQFDAGSLKKNFFSDPLSLLLSAWMRKKMKFVLIEKCGRETATFHHFSPLCSSHVWQRKSTSLAIWCPKWCGKWASELPWSPLTLCFWFLESPTPI